MGELRLPRLIGSGMVLQQKKRVHIWGWDAPHRKIEVSFRREVKTADADEQGRWELWLSAAAPGGPFIMEIRDDAGEKLVLEDVWVGDVWMCSGQSNMELPMNRVKDRYPEEIIHCENPTIRTFKITEHADFHGPLPELKSGVWKAAGRDTILDFSASAYFFAKKMHQMTNIPVGLINASLGGSRIESWMSREMLEGCDDLLDLADQYADDAFVEAQLRKNMENMQKWHGSLEAQDPGVREHWESEDTDDGDWNPIELPCFFRDTELSGLIGSLWLRRTFEADELLASKAARLWLGTMVDSDTVYINGVQVGHTDYQYPPRKYEVPEGLLRNGTNTVVIRLKCENGQGRVTPGKRFSIWNGEREINLGGTWLYRIGAVCEQITPTDFVNWKPTGLYHGMVAPCHAYTIAGVLWYQGEANAHMPACSRYADLMRRLVEGYRKNWEDAGLLFLYVQLPNFRIDLYYGSEEERDSCWPQMREQQRRAQAIPGTGMIVTMDLGEDNDLHPLDKEGIGTRLAMLAGAKLYGLAAESSGPVVKEVIREEGSSKSEWRVRLICGDCEGGLYADSADRGTEITDFELMDDTGKIYTAQVQLKENEIWLNADRMKNPPTEIRYCYRNSNRGALVYNRQGFPMSPFVMKAEGAVYEAVME